MDKKTIVTGVIGADVHAVGNKILTYALEQAGFNVVNLGVMVAQEEYAAPPITQTLYTLVTAITPMFSPYAH